VFFAAFFFVVFFAALRFFGAAFFFAAFFFGAAFFFAGLRLAAFFFGAEGAAAGVIMDIMSAIIFRFSCLSCSDYVYCCYVASLRRRRASECRFLLQPLDKPGPPAACIVATFDSF